jgi:hypothetical protein
VTLAAQALARTVAAQAAFLQAFAERGTVTAACLASRVGRRTVYDWIAHDERFARDFDAARQAAADLLEAECRRRGQDGVDEPVYYRGAVVGYHRRYSDACLLELLKAYRPDRFTGRRAPMGTTAGGAGSTIVRVSYDHKMRPDDLE